MSKAMAANYWTSFCAFVVGWCDSFFTLPNMVMVTAIVVPIATFVAGQYWQNKKFKLDQAALKGEINRRKHNRREARPQ